MVRNEVVGAMHGMQVIHEYAQGIYAIDAGFDRAGKVAVHAIVDDGHVALIDTATVPCVPRVMQALGMLGVVPEQVDYVILTHVHLDHAGGAGALMALLPHARLTVHPRGARHMIDPARLLAATRAVYGEETTRRTYGEVVATARERVIETPHGATLPLGARVLHVHDAPGHARHHVVIHDSASGHVFAGDTFGLSYRELDRDGMQFVFPTTSPSQFDPIMLHRSIDAICALDPAAVYVAHFGQVRDVPRVAADLHRLIDAHVDLAGRAREAGRARAAMLRDGIRDLLLGEAERQRWTLSRQELLEVFALDIELNAQGLEAWLSEAER